MIQHEALLSPAPLFDDALAVTAAPFDESCLDDLFEGAMVDPRPYQLRIASKAISAFEEHRADPFHELSASAASVLVESPTGSGKTVMGLGIAQWMQKHYGLSIGWVSMRRNLLQQAQEENLRRGFDVKLELISMFDKNPPKVDMLIVDEAQHDAASSMANLHCSVRPQYILGLTATPFRSDRVKLCFDTVIKDAGIHQLIQDDYLSRFHHFTIPEYTPEAVAEHYARSPLHWGKSIMFFHRRQQCDVAQTALAAHGIRSEVVTATSDRERQLNDFVAGRVQVLINMSILTEGFDCPDLQTVFCRPSSRACTIQMCGRVFRKHAAHPFKQIVQCRNTPHPILKTATAAEQYVWNGEMWRSLKMNREISKISTRTRQLIAGAEVKLPKLVAAARTSKPFWQQVRESF
ncbi:helicase [Blastopirellula sp. J2-11]|uniref:DEAD/DEAH box helicase n=1 Tax=Blastopirellula sp. J2-11 TaxID=2943192 RepID=UPI0021C9E7CC|nr:DEAD/DEAH box helicase family protein [Blastopirellula sp. J2-11]UUO05298.1 helicase [Blastopirellula sp. J2-11]